MNLKPSEEARMSDVCRIGKDRADEAAQTLTQAFQEDSFTKWLCGLSLKPSEASGLWFGWSMHNQRPLTEVHAMGDMSAIAVWEPSEQMLAGHFLKKEHKKQEKELLKSFLAFVKELYGPNAGVLLKFLKEMEKLKPKGEYWYLLDAGVAPQKQGQGRGSQVISVMLKRCDELGLGAYLEATSPDNKRAYERLGFQETAQVPFDGELYLTTMWRDPQ